MITVDTITDAAILALRAERGAEYAPLQAAWAWPPRVNNGTKVADVCADVCASALGEIAVPHVLVDLHGNGCVRLRPVVHRLPEPARRPAALRGDPQRRERGALMSSSNTPPGPVSAGLAWVPPAWGPARPAVEIFEDMYFEPMLPRDLMRAQGFGPLPVTGTEINHDDAAIREHLAASRVGAVARSINDSMPNPNPFDEEAPTVPDGKRRLDSLAWTSPPCEHFSKKGR